MPKKLSDMTLEELWQLFPIFLTEHRAEWSDWFAEEAARLKQILPAGTRISHIGSTAVEGIWAKPIVDILAEVPEGSTLEPAGEAIVRAGWIRMSADERRMSFNLGYTSEGFAERVFHLHLRHWGDCDELCFRDYLWEHPAEAGEYERLKLSLWKRYEHDRDGYTAAKAEMVAAYTAQARRLYGNRYGGSEDA